MLFQKSNGQRDTLEYFCRRKWLQSWINFAKKNNYELTAQIATTDAEIDNKVFDLYGLTEEEKEVVMKE